MMHGTHNVKQFTLSSVFHYFPQFSHKHSRKSWIVTVNKPSPSISLCHPDAKLLVKKKSSSKTALKSINKKESSYCKSNPIISCFEILAETVLC